MKNVRNRPVDVTKGLLNGTVNVPGRLADHSGSHWLKHCWDVLSAAREKEASGEVRELHPGNGAQVSVPKRARLGPLFYEDLLDATCRSLSQPCVKDASHHS